MDHIGPCVVVGHSLGGRLALELAAADPTRVLGLVLLAPITGAPWDRLQGLLRWSPPVLAGYGVLAALDVAATVPLRTDRAQTLKLSRRIVPSVQSMVLRPWNAFATITAVLRAPASTAALDTVRARRTYQPSWCTASTTGSSLPTRRGRRRNGSTRRSCAFLVWATTG